MKQNKDIRRVASDICGAAVCKDVEAALVEFDGEDDHLHLLVNYPPKVAISMLVNSLKGLSSHMIRKKIIRALPRGYGAVRCGRLAISRGVIAAHQLQ
jgi:REP element-mobilizing transposase RayT